MSVLRIAVCDDDSDIRETLCSYLERISLSAGLELSVTCFDSGENLLKEDHTAFDLLIMDIQMPGIDGLAAARTIRASNEQLTIIFLTNYIQYALEGYEVQAYRFLLKPPDYEKFSAVVGKALTELKSRREAILTIRTKISRIPVEHILYVETYKGNVMVHTDTETIEGFSSMKETEEVLNSYLFCPWF